MALNLKNHFLEKKKKDFWKLTQDGRKSSLYIYIYIYK